MSLGARYIEARYKLWWINPPAPAIRGCRGLGARPGAREILLAILAVANISTASVLVRLAGVHGFVAASWRLILSSLMTIGVLLVVERRARAPAPRDLALMGVAGMALAAHFGLWMESLYHLNVAPSVTIVDSYPALLAIVGRLFFHEEYTRLQLAGAGVAMAGVGGLAFYSSSGGLAPPGGDPVLGSLLAFAGMLGVAVYFIIGKKLREKYSTFEYTAVVYTIAALAEALAVKTIGESLTGYPAETYLYLVLLAVLPMMGGHTIINYLLARMSLVASTIPILGEPVGAGILAWIILGEPVTPGAAILMAITLSGISLVLYGETRRK